MSRPAARGGRRDSYLGETHRRVQGSHPPVKDPQTSLEARGALLPDLLADSVFLLVQDFLLWLCNVTAVLAGHVPLFLADLAVFLVKLRGLSRRELTLFPLLLDPLVLIRKSIVHLISTRMILLPVCFCDGAAGNPSNECRRDSDRENPGPSLEHIDLLEGVDEFLSPFRCIQHSPAAPVAAPARGTVSLK